MSNEVKNADVVSVWKEGEADYINTIFGTDGDTLTVPPSWLSAFIDEKDFVAVLKIIKGEGFTVATKREVHAIRAIQRTAALDAIRDFFYAKAKEILEKGECK